MRSFWLCFLPLFVAVDAVGVLPLFLGLTEGLERHRVRRVIAQSVITASAVALLFLAIGRAVLGLLGITIHDFMIAGGALLFVLSVRDLLALGKPLRQVDPDTLGAVPLGVPIMVGPAVLATSLLLLNEHGPVLTAAAVVTNVALAGAALWLAEPIYRVLGVAGAKTVSKVASLLLASIAVMMVRRGIEAFLARGPS